MRLVATLEKGKTVKRLVTGTAAKLKRYQSSSSISRRAVTAVLFALVALATGGSSVSAAPAERPHDHAPTLAPPGQEPTLKSAPQQKPTTLGALTVETSVAAPAAVASPPVKMKLLVVTADGSSGAAQTDLLAIETFLKQIGIPYDVLVAANQDLTSSFLTDGTTGNYQGVILESGSLVYYDPATGTFPSAFTVDEWQALWNYEAQFKVRQATWYTYPFGTSDNFNYGLSSDPPYADTQAAPLEASLTTEGKAVFGYLNPNSPVTFKSAWVYLPKIADAATTTPLLTTSSNEVIASTHRYADGRENLAVTADNAWFLTHSQLLSYGVINWVTRGIFLGERHVNVDVQPDDILIDDDQWDTACNCDTSSAVPPYRMTGDDYTKLIAWQDRLRSSNPALSQFKLEFPYNGQGSTDGAFSSDTLTLAIRANSGSFNWINHTWTHANLDFIDYAGAKTEIQKNSNAAKTLGLVNFKKSAMVQPDISGLNNPSFLQAAFDIGIRYIISDASRSEWTNPTPNTGFYSVHQPGILVIPRRANNLFYNVRTPEQWVDEFNCYYSWGRDPINGDPGNQLDSGTCVDQNNKFWRFYKHDKTYQEILDKESSDLLSYMLRWDLDPWMFHQPNSATYDGARSLLGDLLDRTMEKYLAAYNLPIRNLPQHEVGALMANRMAYDESGVSAVLAPCQSITLTTGKSAPVPVTGLSTRRAETYGGQKISTVQVAAGTPVTLPVSC